LEPPLLYQVRHGSPYEDTFGEQDYAAACRMMPVDRAPWKLRVTTAVIRPQHVHDVGILALCDALHGSRTITSLDLGRNEGADDDFEGAWADSVGTLLSVNTSLVSLHMSHVRLGRSQLVSGLCGNATLTELWLDKCSVGNAQAAALGAVLAHNTSLRSINLEENPNISCAGATALAQGLHTNGTLRELRLWRANIRRAGALGLIASLARCRLTNLNMVGCKMDNACVAALVDRLETNTVLEEFSFKDNYDATDQAGMSAIGDALERNRRFSWLCTEFLPLEKALLAVVPLCADVISLVVEYACAKAMPSCQGHCPTPQSLRFRMQRIKDGYL
jgi:hypothetical protein